MEHSYRVLGIAPYEGMKTLMADLAEEYPQMDLTLFVGIPPPDQPSGFSSPHRVQSPGRDMNVP